MERGLYLDWGDINLANMISDFISRLDLFFSLFFCNLSVDDKEGGRYSVTVVELHSVYPREERNN